MEQWGDHLVRAAIVALVGGIVALFARLRKVEARQEAFVVRFESLTSIPDDLNALRVLLAERFVDREDWVPAMSKILGRLESHGETLARLDERLRITTEKAE